MTIYHERGEQFLYDYLQLAWDLGNFLDFGIRTVFHGKYLGPAACMMLYVATFVRI